MRRLAGPILRQSRPAVQAGAGGSGKTSIGRAAAFGSATNGLSGRAGGLSLAGVVTLLPRAADSPAATRPRDPAFWLLAGVVAAVLVAGKCLMHASAHTADLDTGNYSNLIWGIVHGQGLTGSVLGRAHFGEHFSPIVFLIAPLYLVWQSAYILMALQGLAVAAGVMLTLRFAADRMAEAGFDGPSHARARFCVNALLLVLMSLYPPLLATWATQFQPVELGLPLVLLGLMLLHAPATRANTVWLAAVVVLLLMTRESAPLSVAGLAIYAAAARRRWRLAAVLAVVAAAWFAVVMGVAMPYFRDSPRWGHTRFLGPWGMWDRKWFYLLALIGGMGFLPLLGRRALWACAAAVPGVLLNLSVTRLPQVAFQAHYDAQTAPFFMAAAALGATWLARQLFAPVPRWRAAWAAASAAVLSATVIVLISDAKSPPEQLWRWLPTATDRRMIAEARAAAARYADAPALLGDARIGPHVCHRLDYRSIRVRDPRKWADWARQRVSPGSILLLPGLKYAAMSGTRDTVRLSGWAEPISRTPYLEVYRWPADAPEPGTAAMKKYVWAGLAKTDAFGKNAAAEADKSDGGE